MTTAARFMADLQQLVGTEAAAQRASDDARFAQTAANLVMFYSTPIAELVSAYRGAEPPVADALLAAIRDAAESVLRVAVVQLARQRGEVPADALVSMAEKLKR